MILLQLIISAMLLLHLCVTIYYLPLFSPSMYLSAVYQLMKYMGYLSRRTNCYG